MSKDTSRGTRRRFNLDMVASMFWDRWIVSVVGAASRVRTDEWVNRISKELLDVPHLHLTLTIAKEMRLYFDHDRNLLKLLLTVAAEAVRQVIALTYGNIRVGLVYTCHTFGRELVFKPHIHLVIPKEG